jgi:hypothetical protein
MNIQQEIKTGFQAWIKRRDRDRSGERDFGVQWTIDETPATRLQVSRSASEPDSVQWTIHSSSRSYPHWRCSWIESTGELYAVRLDGDELDAFILIANFPDEEAVELALEGWTDIAPNLPALIAQARSGVKAPRRERAPTESANAFDLSDLDLSLLDSVPAGEEKIGLEAAACVRRGGKAYCARRALDGECRIVVVSSNWHNKMISSPLHHVVKHSPSGFEFGYAGSGPADTSLSILADYFGERPTKDDVYYGRGKAVHPPLYQQFKRDFIAPAPEEGFTITSDQIKAWLAENAYPLADETQGEEE